VRLVIEVKKGSVSYFFLTSRARYRPMQRLTIPVKMLPKLAAVNPLTKEAIVT
jgi:hypothetical protein